MANGVAGTGAGTVALGAGLERVEIVTRSGRRGYSAEDKARLVGGDAAKAVGARHHGGGDPLRAAPPRGDCREFRVGAGG